MRIGVSWMRTGVSWMRIGLNECGIFECKLNADSKNSEISVEELSLNHSYWSLVSGLKWTAERDESGRSWAKVDGHERKQSVFWAKLMKLTVPEVKCWKWKSWRFKMNGQEWTAQKYQSERSLVILKIQIFSII